MSEPLRKKLAQEIRDNVADRIGGEYFDYLIIKVDKKRYTEILEKRLEAQGKPIVPAVEILRKKWGTIGDKIRNQLNKMIF